MLRGGGWGLCFTRKVSLSQYPHIKVTFPLVISIYTGNLVKWYNLIKKKKVCWLQCVFKTIEGPKLHRASLAVL